ncbi:hypothetical protein PR048_015021 [Dryococelus australis]|uniref:Uncharacterized protein n=1 Tax=Dryococelus australis TaxID=614101 RepID=A0ABQ9HFU0_9NEOP|nr:hypothetical protein PR048_015021 [Dryococelus australis]
MLPLPTPCKCVRSAVRREHCTLVQNLALSGNRALDVRGSVALIAPTLLARLRNRRPNLCTQLPSLLLPPLDLYFSRAWRTKLTSNAGIGRALANRCSIKSAAVGNGIGPARLWERVLHQNGYCVLRNVLYWLGRPLASIGYQSPIGERRSNISLASDTILLACAVNQARLPAGSPTDFRMRDSCRTMPLVGGFSRGCPVSPALAFRCCCSPYSPRFTLIGCQDLDVRSRPNLFVVLRLNLQHALFQFPPTRRILKETAIPQRRPERPRGAPSRATSLGFSKALGELLSGFAPGRCGLFGRDETR